MSLAAIDRRQFFRSSGLSVVAIIVNAQRTVELLADPLELPVGLQLYTVRDACDKDLGDTLRKVAEIGYKEVELGSLTYYSRKPAEIRKLLDSNGLKCTSAFYNTDMMKSGWDRHIGEAGEMGASYMVCASLDAPDRKSLSDIRRMADFFNRAGEQCQGAGLDFAYHCHNFDFKVLDGVIAYDELLRDTDPNFVKLEADCFWITMAGKDPVEYFKRYPGRFPLLHVKDLKPGFAPTTDPVRGGNPFAEVGRGTIKWSRIFAAAREGGLKHYAVEQDRCDRSPLESIKISYDYLHHLKV